MISGNVIGPTAEHTRRLQLLERAGRVVWILQSRRDGRVERSGVGHVWGVWPTLEAACRAAEDGTQFLSGWRLRPNDGPCDKRWPDQPPEGWGAYYWNGWPENSVSIAPYLLGTWGEITPEMLDEMSVVDLLAACAR